MIACTSHFEFEINIFFFYQIIPFKIMTKHHEHTFHPKRDSITHVLKFKKKPFKKQQYIPSVLINSICNI